MDEVRGDGQSIVLRPVNMSSLFACLNTSLHSPTPLAVAEISTNRALTVFAITRASVVFPHPALPQRIILGIRPSSINPRSTPFGPTSSCPQISSRVCGRIRSARGFAFCSAEDPPLGFCRFGVEEEEKDSAVVDSVKERFCGFEGEEKDDGWEVGGGEDFITTLFELEAAGSGDFVFNSFSFRFGVFCWKMLAIGLEFEEAVEKEEKEDEEVVEEEGGVGSQVQLESR